MGAIQSTAKAIELLRPGHTFAEVSPSGATLLLAELDRLLAELDEARRERSGMQHLAQKNRTALDEARAELAQRGTTIATVRALADELDREARVWKTGGRFQWAQGMQAERDAERIRALLGAGEAP